MGFKVTNRKHTNTVLDQTPLNEADQRRNVSQAPINNSNSETSQAIANKVAIAANSNSISSLLKQIQGINSNLATLLANANNALSMVQTYDSTLTDLSERVLQNEADIQNNITQINNNESDINSLNDSLNQFKSEAVAYALILG